LAWRRHAPATAAAPLAGSGIPGDLRFMLVLNLLC
jgi:hypothetical protein